MKRILTILAAVALVAAASLSVYAFVTPMNQQENQPDSRGHQLGALWKAYYEAVDKDRPKTQAEVLEKIIAQAREQRFSWDFYDAWTKYVEAVTSRDWKQRDRVSGEFAQAVRDYDEPVVTYVWQRNQQSASLDWQKDFVVRESERLRSGRNAAFYNHYFTTNFLAGILPELIENDEEYVLWAMTSSAGNGWTDFTTDPVYKMVQDCVGDNYPKAAYLRYRAAAKWNDYYRTEAGIRQVMEKWPGTGMALYAEDDLFSIRKSILDRSKSGQQDYKDLFAYAQDFERRRKAVTDPLDRRIVSGLSGANKCIAELTSQSTEVTVDGAKVTVRLRNIKNVKVALYEREGKRALWSTNVRNDAQRFYVYDTVTTVLPPVNDGSYRVEASAGKDVTDTDFFDKYTLSMALRKAAEGYGAYVTDYESGEPLTKADLVLFSGDRAKASVKAFALGEGFTLLPDKLVGGRSKEDVYYRLQASFKGEDGLVRKSRLVPVTEDYYIPDEWRTGKYCRLFTDRGAYNPGDEVHFKALLYQGDMVRTVGVAKAGISVKASFYDAESNKLDEVDLQTNEFGTVSGVFTIPTGLRNGRFNLRVSGEGYSAYRNVRVDEFVLPTFDLSFDRNEKLYLPGDEVEVSGTLKSYSGHSLASTDLRWVAEFGSQILGEDSLKPAADGTFRFRFKTLPGQDWQYIRVTANVVDATGETHEYSTGYAVGTYFSLGLSLANAADAQLAEIVPKSQENRSFIRSSLQVLDGEKAHVTFLVNNRDGGRVPVEVSYKVFAEDETELLVGKAFSGEETEIDLSPWKTGLFTIRYEVNVPYKGHEPIHREERYKLVKLSADAPVLDVPVRYVFRTFGLERETGDDIRVQFGAADGPVWAVVELSGEERRILDRKTVLLTGGRGAVGSVTDIVFHYQETYPDAVRLKVFFFRDRGAVTFERQYHRHRHTLDLPLSFTSFEDHTFPATEYTFRMKTLPGVECLAAVFDKSLDTIEPNEWEQVYLSAYGVPSLSLNYSEGVYGRPMEEYLYYESKANGRGIRRKGAALGAAPMVLESAVERVVEMEDAVAGAEPMSEGEAAGVTLRENFANMLAFRPHILSDAEGNMSLTFTTSDKLSTYYVALFAHDRQMRNATLRRETVVSIPVKVAVQEPKYLYVGDKLRLTVTASSNADAPVRGRLALFQYATADHSDTPMATQTVSLTVPAHKVSSHTFDVAVPDEAGTIGLKVVFLSDDEGGFSDAVFYPVPVYGRTQVLTEAHSGVLLAGADKEALIAQIRKAFVNTSSMGAEYKEISIIDMVREAIPGKVEPASTNVLCLSEAWYVRLIAESLGGGAATYEMPTDKLLARIGACQNADGGLSWFEGMDSSPMITSIVLERIAHLRELSLVDKVSFIDVTKAVKFLDKNEFDLEWPFWCGGVSTDQYLYIRSLWAEVPFKVEATGKLTDFVKRMAEFKKYTVEYLVPDKVRGLNGRIHAKARRLKTIQNLLASPDGIALAKAWGVGWGAADKLRASLEDDVVSLLEYAVDHRDGGIYYPNVVMPFRGLLESEAYAHAMLANLFTAYTGTESREEALRVADGLRIWLMLQKETQKWDEDPAFVDAIHSIMLGSDAVKQTRVILMRKTFEKPFTAIKAAGNGMTIARKCYRIRSEGDRLVEEPIASGTVLSKGDKIRVVYSVWNAENRSYIRIRAPREATLRPVQQLSGMYGWGIRPLRVTGWFSFQPHGYRDVKTDRTEYWFDTYPEEKTTVSEEFFVTQSGTFSAPVVEIESLYAPHYRANSASSATLKVD